MAKVTTSLFGELAVIPYPAQIPTSKTLEFLTEVMTADDGKEERNKLRVLPRVKFSYSVPIAAWRTASTFNTLYGALRQKWAVPDWTQPQFVGNILDNATTIACDTLLHDLRPNSLALVYAGCNSWQIIEIGTITDTSIEVTSDTINMNNCYLVPVRVGYIDDDVTKQTNGYNENIQLNFEVDSDLLALTPSAPEQYLGDDIYYDAPLIEGLTSRSLTQEYNKSDNKTGLVTRMGTWLAPKYNIPFSVVLDGKAEIKAFIDFFYRRAGKYRQFWQPLFESNFRLLSVGAITTTLLVENDYYFDFPTRTHISILKSDGTWHNRIISNPTVVAGGKLQLTLNASLGFNASDVQYITYLGLVRLGTDSITLNFLGNNIAQVSFNEVEILA